MSGRKRMNNRLTKSREEPGGRAKANWHVSITLLYNWTPKVGCYDLL